MVTSSAESLRSPTFIIAVILLAIGAATVGAMLRIGNPEITAGIGNLVIGLTLGSVSGYFLGASKHSGPAADPASGTTTTTVTPPTIATVTVETNPSVDPNKPAT